MPGAFCISANLCNSEKHSTMATKNNRPKMIVATSPKGVFVFPKLNEPDYGSKDYPVPLGQYVVRLRVSKDDPKVQAFIAKMEKVLEQARATAEEKLGEMKVAARKKLEAANGGNPLKANPLFTEIYDEETEEPTGEIEFKFQMPAKVEIKKGPKAGRTMTFAPVIVDARGIAIPSNKLPAIWGGTEGIVSFEYVEGGYFIEGSGLYGVKMRLLGVQIITLKSGGGRSSSDLGFTQQEGFSGDDLAESDDEENEDSNEGNGETDSGSEEQDF